MTQNIRLREIRIAYLPDEDRLLFTCGLSDDSEQRFWFTRKLAKALLGATEKRLTESANVPLSAPPSVARTVLAFEESAALAKGNVQAGQVSLPVGADATIEATLVRRGALEPRVSEGQDPFSATAWQLILADGRGKGARLTLTRENMLRFRHMIARAAARAEWDIGPTEFADPTMAVGPPN